MNEKHFLFFLPKLIHFHMPFRAFPLQLKFKKKLDDKQNDINTITSSSHFIIRIYCDWMNAIFNSPSGRIRNMQNYDEWALIKMEIWNMVCAWLLGGYSLNTVYSLLYFTALLRRAFKRIFEDLIFILILINFYSSYFYSQLMKYFGLFQSLHRTWYGNVWRIRR